ncbi:unnamed protein product, partial [Prorocentrum cordatum]
FAPRRQRPHPADEIQAAFAQQRGAKSQDAHGCVCTQQLGKRGGARCREEGEEEKEREKEEGVPLLSTPVSARECGGGTAPRGPPPRRPPSWSLGRPSRGSALARAVRAKAPGSSLPDGPCPRTAWEARRDERRREGKD